MENINVVTMRGTVFENGYGLLPRKAMRDKRLKATAKSIYAYICSFAEAAAAANDRTAFPGVAIMCDELGISEDTFYKHRKSLISLGYLSIEKQRKEGSKFDNNLYIINAVVTEKEPSSTVVTVKTKPHPKKQGMEKPHPNFSDTEKPCTEKTGTIINSPIINSYTNNSIKTPSPSPLDIQELNIPYSLQVVLKNKGLSLSDSQILEIEKFYNTQPQFIKPGNHDSKFLNDTDFTYLVADVLDQVPTIHNMSGILTSWATHRMEHKEERAAAAFAEEHPEIIERPNNKHLAEFYDVVFGSKEGSGLNG